MKKIKRHARSSVANFLSKKLLHKTFGADLLLVKVLTGKKRQNEKNIHRCKLILFPFHSESKTTAYYYCCVHTSCPLNDIKNDINSYSIMIQRVTVQLSVSITTFYFITPTYNKQMYKLSA